MDFSLLLDPKGQSTRHQGRGRAVIFDTETHDKNDPRVVETAYGYIEAGRLCSLDVSSIVVERFNPGLPISFGAMATHHILPEDLEGMPPSEDFSLPHDVSYIIGHNVGFDLDAIGCPLGYRLIDTLALARVAWPDLDSHTQSGIFYWLHSTLGMDMSAARDFLRNAHSAGADIQICGFILRHVIQALQDRLVEQDKWVGRELNTLERLYIYSQAAKVPLKMTFGKHLGDAPWETPISYQSWYAKCEAPAPDPMILMSMLKGGHDPYDQAQFALAVRNFGPQSARVDSDQAQQPEVTAGLPLVGAAPALHTRPRFGFDSRR